MTTHISIRVPWHDNGWNGSICNDPSTNVSCLRLANILDNRDENLECSNCGKCMKEFEEDLPCIPENGSFMSEVPLEKTQIHPYKGINKLYDHFLETTVVYPPYSFSCRPYSWLLNRNIQNRFEDYGIEYNKKIEPDGFFTNWIQDGHNHKAVFDWFYKDVKPMESICIAYAKQVPFFENKGRVVIGMGFVKEVIPAVEHNHTDKGIMTSMTWETRICHTIRKDNKDGFLIPYQEMVEFAKDNPNFDLNSIIVTAPDYAFDEFSFATEHVSYDATIDVINSCIKVFNIISSCLDRDYTDTIDWLKKRKEEVWKQRGAFPGFGSMLCAMGIEWGKRIESEFKNKINSNDDFWLKVDDLFNQPKKYVSSECLSRLNDTARETWKNMRNDRKQLFKLLSRFSITVNQARAFYNPEFREREKIRFTDEEIIDNPYILYERTRLKSKETQDSYFVSIEKVDKAVFPIKEIIDNNPLDNPSALTSDNDKRRIRAVAISIMEKAAENGHTIYPEFLLLNRMHDLILDPVCEVSFDMIQSLREFLEEEMFVKTMPDGKFYYKLNRMQEFDDAIERSVRRRLKADKIVVNTDWNKLLDKEFGPAIDNEEQRARIEKAAVLKMLAESHISVLIGGAGTGKTKTLSILCNQKDIARGKVLLLAPTGKATVRLNESLSGNKENYQFYNIAQLLVKCGRYSGEDRRYILEGDDYDGLPDTVIVDESSMLTTEMMGALLQTVRRAKRIIFVGDPHQLPPIGAGRPFVDLVNILKTKSSMSFPFVSESYGELIINRRQKEDEEDRLDIRLSELFSGKEDIVDENAISELSDNNSKHIKFIKWNKKEDLQEKLLSVSSEYLGMKDSDDIKGFNAALGGTASGDYYYFNKGCSDKVNDWQIISPIHGMPNGTDNINRLFHKKYRNDFLKLSAIKKVPKPFGPDEIVYGDKVINVVNRRRKSQPELGSSNYIANGEIGIVCDCFFTNGSEKPVTVEFSSQKGFEYTFNSKDIDTENNSASLELAYALTVHKAQGSQFKNVIFVLSENCSLLSRELLYTALTRQESSITILYNGDPYQLYRYTSESYSTISRRFTDLFSDFEESSYKPRIVEINNGFYDDRLIHRTEKGELVRSKSEVIIANMLYSHHIDYAYEREVVFDNGITVHPDFIIYDEINGKEWFWEHCGMLEDPGYFRNWKRKEQTYKNNGIIENDNLIITKDVNGTIDSAEISRIIKEHFE